MLVLQRLTRLYTLIAKMDFTNFVKIQILFSLSRDLKTGNTLSHFQASGNYACRIIRLYRWYKGWHRSVAQSLTKNTGISLGPVAKFCLNIFAGLKKLKHHHWWAQHRETLQSPQQFLEIEIQWFGETNSTIFLCGINYKAKSLFPFCDSKRMVQWCDLLLYLPKLGVFINISYMF